MTGSQVGISKSNVRAEEAQAARESARCMAVWGVRVSVFERLRAFPDTYSRRWGSFGAVVLLLSWGVTILVAWSLGKTRDGVKSFMKDVADPSADKRTSTMR